MPEGYDWQDTLQRWFYQVRHLSDGKLAARVEVLEGEFRVHLQSKGDGSLCTFRGSGEGVMAYLQGIANALYLVRAEDGRA